MGAIGSYPKYYDVYVFEGQELIFLETNLNFLELVKLLREHSQRSFKIYESKTKLQIPVSDG